MRRQAGPVKQNVQVHNLPINPIRPIIPQHLHVGLALEGPLAPGHDGHLPAQALAQHEIHDAAVPPAQLVVVGQVAAEVGGQALEGGEGVARDDGAHLGPLHGAVVGVGRREDGLVFRAEVEQVGRA